MTGSEYDFWLLDLDGTLVDVEEAYVHEVFDEVGARLGCEFSNLEAEYLWYGVGERRERVLAQVDVTPGRFWEVFHDVEDPIARAEATYLFEDATDVVPRIAEPVGLVTHCQEYLTDPILRSLGIGDWFDTVVCCTDETGWKPDPGPVELAMADLGVANNGHVGVLAGDDTQDVGAAINAGLDAVHVTREHRREHPCEFGDRHVTTLSALGT